MLSALITAEELGVTLANVMEMAQETNHPEINWMLGSEGSLGEMLDLEARWATRAIAADGNYAEIFERFPGVGSLLALRRGLSRSIGTAASSVPRRFADVPESDCRSDNPPYVDRFGCAATDDRCHDGRRRAGPPLKWGYADAGAMRRGCPLPDGIAEAMNVDHEQFTGVHREAELAAERALPVDPVLADVTDALGTFVGEAEQSDAIICMVPLHGGCYTEGATTAQFPPFGRDSLAFTHSQPLNRTVTC